MPVGTQPPLILNYSASTVPVLQMAFSSTSLSEQQVLDYSQNFARPRLTTVQGAAVPYSYGGKFRAVQIDLAWSMLVLGPSSTFRLQPSPVLTGTLESGRVEQRATTRRARKTSGTCFSSPKIVIRKPSTWCVRAPR